MLLTPHKTKYLQNIKSKGEPIINKNNKKVFKNKNRTYVKRTLRLNKKLDSDINKVQQRQIKLGHKLSQNKIINIVLDNKIKKLTNNLLTQKQANLVIKNQKKELLNQGKANEIIGGLANNINQFQRYINYQIETGKLSSNETDLKEENQAIKDIRKQVNTYYGKNCSIR